MKLIPSYSKILTLGSAYTDNALDGEVVIQEKVDGSQFAFGISDESALLCRSKGQSIQLEAPNNLFKPAVEHVIKLANSKAFGAIPDDSYFYGETLSTPKHNTLKYERTPKNNIVLFDGIVGGKYLTRLELESVAKSFDVDVVPELYRGLADVDRIKQLMDTQSYLGGEVIEGVVVKNYSQTIMLGGQVMPLFTKYVRESFKERNLKDWKAKSPKGDLTALLQSFKTEARWVKAKMFLRDQNLLVQEPKDIGPLIKRVHQDILEEEKENIKNDLFKIYEDDILRISTNGLPQWYKNQLLETLKVEDDL